MSYDLVMIDYRMTLAYASEDVLSVFVSTCIVKSGKHTDGNYFDGPAIHSCVV